MDFLAITIKQPHLSDTWIIGIIAWNSQGLLLETDFAVHEQILYMQN